MGESPGAKVGGVVQQVAREFRVEALPSAIPEHIEVDISGLELGDTLRLQDVEEIEGVTFLDPPDTVVANCSSPRGLTEAEEAADEAIAAEAAAESAAEADATAAPDEE